MKYWKRCAAAGLLAMSFVGVAQAAAPLGPAALRARHAGMAQQLAQNAFGGPVVLQSQEASRRIEGDVYAVLDHPFESVRGALSDPGRWCEILMLHLNTKHCRRADGVDGPRVEVRVGKKEPQAVSSATLLAFGWKAPVTRADYLSVQMDAVDGPYDTRDYQLMAEAVPLEGGRTFLHMGYALSHGAASEIAMKVYLGTKGQDKVGFTRTKAGDDGFVGGMRGVVERNTMRYYLAIDAYLDSLSLPGEQQVEKRLQAWFDATEKYPRQLREVGREDYLRMKRAELLRLTAAR
ncbi:hypothetical protein WG902_02790 [Ramlibacter sp. PS3R-8]|uniref:hypothetical protein n=1 Tax=Ramlibacter sp. PS3R-8 TaxID=3133437 RepID=UPI0030B6F824